MNKELAISLKEQAEYTANVFSNPDRIQNYENETFEVDQIIPQSDSVAFVIFKKNTGKQALALYYYVNVGQGKWYYFFPTDSHILGFQNLMNLKRLVEATNFKENFKEG